MGALVYLITNQVNGKRYVGVTRRTLKYRWYHHCFAAKHGGKLPLAKAIRKYGEGAFRIAMLKEVDTVEAAFDLEINYIRDLAPEYNVSTGGIAPIGVKWSPERRKKFAVSARKSWTPERKQYHSDRLRGKPMPKACTEKMRVMSREYHYKPVICLNDGSVFPSIKAAAKALAISNRRGISEVLAGRQYFCKGLSFVYVADGRVTDAERLKLLAERKQKSATAGFRRNASKRRPVTCLTDGQTFQSGRAAAAHFGMTPVEIMQACQGGRVRQGRRFAYVDAEAH